ncbi:MAG: histidine kinase [Chloroflexota bacterium]|nr:histidine kinase [Chloroflexota bacterium]
MKTAFVVLCGLLVSSILRNMWSFWRVLRPVKKLAARATQLAQGDMNALQQPCGGIGEIEDLRHTMASMAEHVQRAQREGLTFRHSLTDGQEAERARIARELHDDTVQSLVAIAQSIELSLSWIETDSTRAKVMLNMARTQAIESVDNVRRLIADLRPPALEELGVAAALKMLAQQEQDIQVEVSVCGIERRITEPHELALFRVAQEALRNAQRHGQPKHIRLELSFYPNEIRLVISDDGVGFRPPQPINCLAQEAHYGLIGMQERVQQLHGTFRVSSQPGGGTSIGVVLPLDNVVQPTESVRDPVCGAIILPQQAYGSTLYDGERCYFCCPVCQGAFQQNPASYFVRSTPQLEHDQNIGSQSLRR